jgi:hypothetical protein
MNSVGYWSGMNGDLEKGNPTHHGMMRHEYECVLLGFQFTCLMDVKKKDRVTCQFRLLLLLLLGVIDPWL